MSPRFHLFVSVVNQGNKGTGWVQDFLVCLQEWKDSPSIFCKLFHFNLGWGTQGESKISSFCFCC